jgi:hypothetical protein
LTAGALESQLLQQLSSTSEKPRTVINNKHLCCYVTFTYNHRHRFEHLLRTKRGGEEKSKGTRMRAMRRRWQHEHVRLGAALVMKVSKWMLQLVEVQRHLMTSWG